MNEDKTDEPGHREDGRTCEEIDVQVTKDVVEPNRTPQLPISDIKVDMDILGREHIYGDTVSQYAALMRDGVNFPPIDVFYDGETYWLSDGFHRLEARRTLDEESVVVRQFKGGKREAYLHGVSANQRHGQPKTRKEKRQCVERLLNDPEWSQWGNREIARQAGVDEKTVRNVKEAICGISADTTKRKVRRKGTVYDQRLSHSSKSDPPPETIKQLAVEISSASMTAKGCGLKDAHRLLQRAYALVQKYIQEPTVASKEASSAGKAVL